VWCQAGTHRANGFGHTHTHTHTHTHGDIPGLALPSPKDDHYLRIENARRLCFDRRVFIYLLIYLYECYSQNSKSIEPNRMKFGEMIVYYPETS